MKKLIKTPINTRKLGLKAEKVLFITDEKIWQNCSRFFAGDFLENFLILKNPQADEKNLKKIISAAKNYDFILGLGSGTINDLCKLSASKLDISYAIIASATSMNGYCSKNASIKIKGHKKTIAATLPDKVFCNLEILKSAPHELIQAGIGDALCFYSCWFDWYLSHLVFKTKFLEKPFKILEKKMDFLVKNYQKFSLQDEKFLEILLEILLLSGQGMTIAGGSYPASQSEHLIAHSLDMKYDLKNIFHGQQIAITTITSLILQEKLLKKQKLIFNQDPFPLDELRDLFDKKITLECKKEFLQKKLTAKKINTDLEKNWKNYQKKLAKIHFKSKKLQKIFQHFKIDFSIKSLKISQKQYDECSKYAKFIRNRFTCLDFIN
jgi:glycerol-1-phosphate dehydrogenase [NAD(P)+]